MDGVVVCSLPSAMMCSKVMLIWCHCPPAEGHSRSCSPTDEGCISAPGSPGTPWKHAGPVGFGPETAWRVPSCSPKVPSCSAPPVSGPCSYYPGLVFWCPLSEIVGTRLERNEHIYRQVNTHGHKVTVFLIKTLMNLYLAILTGMCFM